MIYLKFGVLLLLTVVIQFPIFSEKFCQIDLYYRLIDTVFGHQLVDSKFVAAFSQELVMKMSFLVVWINDMLAATSTGIFLKNAVTIFIRINTERKFLLALVH